MPVRFRCPGCEGLLSIARRKAGSEILCPKCGEALIVPPPLDSDDEPEPEPEPVPPPPPPKRPEPAGVGAGAKPVRRRSTHEPDTEMLIASPELLVELDPPPPKKIPTSKPVPEPVAAPLPVSMPKPAPAPAPAAPPKPKPKPNYAPGEEPLFERSDFEQLLNPNGTKKGSGDTAESESADGTSPSPVLDGRPKIAADAMPAAIPIADDGMYVSKGAAIMLGILLVVMLGLAFAVGFLMGT